MAGISLQFLVCWLPPAKALALAKAREKRQLLLLPKRCSEADISTIFNALDEARACTTYKALKSCIRPLRALQGP